MQSSYLETIKALNGKIYNINYHQKRYESVLKTFNIKSNKQLVEYLNPPKDGLYRCRLIYDIQENISVSYHKYKKKDIKSLKLIYNNDISYKLKSTNREILDKLFLLKDTQNDILIVKNSLITDTTIANIALYKNGYWYTPKEPLLKGITRERYLEEGIIVEKDIYVKDIYKYSRVALLNAMIDFDIIQKKDIRNIIC